MFKIKALLSALLLAISLNAEAAMRVVTSTQDLAAITSAIGGKHVQVESLTLGTRDPHYAVAKPSMIHKVYRADLLIVVGADMEVGWLPPLIQSARNPRIQLGSSGYLDTSSVIPLLGKIQGPISRNMGDVHANGNPHYWLDPRNGIRMAKAITERLSILDPENSEVFQRRFNEFEKEIKEKLMAWQERLLHLNKKPVVAYHNSFLYLANAFNFNIVDEVESKPGIAPSAASLNSLVKRIQQEQIGFLIIEPYYEKRSANFLNKQTGIKVIVLPQSVGAYPEIMTYFDLFETIVQALEKAGDS